MNLFLLVCIGVSRMAGTLVTRWRNCSRHRQDIESRMRPRAHLPVLQAPTSTRVTATAARLPISRVPRRILRKAMALSRVRLGRCLLTSTIGVETTVGGPRKTSTRLPTQRRKPQLPVTTKLTKRILRATRTTAGTWPSIELLLVLSSLLSVILIAFCFSRHLSFTRCYVWIDATRVLKSPIFLIFDF